MFNIMERLKPHMVFFRGWTLDFRRERKIYGTNKINKLVIYFFSFPTFFFPLLNPYTNPWSKHMLRVFYQQIGISKGALQGYKDRLFQHVTKVKPGIQTITVNKILLNDKQLKA